MPVQFTNNFYFICAVFISAFFKIKFTIGFNFSNFIIRIKIIILKTISRLFTKVKTSFTNHRRFSHFITFAYFELKSPTSPVRVKNFVSFHFLSSSFNFWLMLLQSQSLAVLHYLLVAHKGIICLFVSSKCV